MQKTRLGFGSVIVAFVVGATTGTNDAVLVRPEERHEAEAVHVAHLHLAQQPAAANAVRGAAAHHLALLVAHEAEKHPDPAAASNEILILDCNAMRKLNPACT